MDQVVQKIIEGIQERKGHDITVVDMAQLEDAPCEFFVIAEGDSNVHVNAIALSVRDYVRDTIHEKPYAIDGLELSQWVALDYGHIIVHVFQRPQREFYDIEHLWADAKLVQLQDLEN